MKQLENTENMVELSLSDIIGFFRRYFLFFFLVGVLSGIGGYLLSFTFQDQYKATALVLPEYSSSSFDGGLGELANLAVLMRRNRTEAIRPDLFPDIVLSTQSAIKLLSTPLTDQYGKKTTLLKVLDVKGEAEPFTENQLTGRDSVLSLTRHQRAVLANLKGRLSVSYGRGDGVVTISAELPDPRLAAETAQLAVDYLVGFITDYRTGKERRKVLLLEEQTAKAQEVYRKASVALNTHRDRNQNIFTHTAGMEGQRLQLEFQRTQSLYSELMQRLELARLQLEDNSLVLKVLEPPLVPYATSKPRRLIMAAGFIILGGLLALFYALFIGEKVHKKLNFG